MSQSDVVCLSENPEIAQTYNLCPMVQKGTRNIQIHLCDGIASITPYLSRPFEPACLFAEVHIRTATKMFDTYVLCFSLAWTRTRTLASVRLVHTAISSRVLMSG